MNRDENISAQELLKPVTQIQQTSNVMGDFFVISSVNVNSTFSIICFIGNY